MSRILLVWWFLNASVVLQVSCVYGGNLTQVNNTHLEENNSISAQASLEREKKISNCRKNNAIARILDDGTVDCVCESGFRMINNTCKDIICLDYSESCRTLCRSSDIQRAQKHGCCLGWEPETCVEPAMPSCEPGYVQQGTTCIDACTANLTTEMCQHGCEPGNQTKNEPFYCRCKGNEVFSRYSLVCEDKGACTSEEENDCLSSGYTQCFMEDSAHLCACGENQRFDGIKCSGTFFLIEIEFEIKENRTTYSTEIPCPNAEKIAELMRKKTGVKHITAKDVVCTKDKKVKIRFAVSANESENVIAATKQCTTIPGKEGQCLLGGGVYMKAGSIKSDVVTNPPSTTVELTTARASTENVPSIPSEESTDSSVSLNPVTELQTTSHASTIMSPTTTQQHASFPEREATTSIPTDVAITENETASESGTTRSTTDLVPTSNTTDLCRTFGVEICGALPCVQTQDMFECKCDDSQYFDSAAKECQSIHNCNVEPCKVGKCEDDNGKSNRRCICDNPDLTEDCNVSKAKETSCSNKNARAKLNDHGNVECVCQAGFKMIGDKCIDVICLDYSSTCKTLCGTTDLRRAQDQGCCLGWKNESCKAQPPKESCDPGYIFRDGSCTDACTAGGASKMCNRGCTPGAEHSGVPFYCNCGENEQFNDYTLLCEARSKCNAVEENNCTANGYSQCFMKEGAHNCKCRETEMYNGERCTSTCSKKALEACRERKAECAINGNTEECVCRLPKAFNGDDVCTQDGIKVIEIEFQISEPTSTLYSIAVVDRESEEIAEAVRAKTGHKHVTAENVIYNRDNNVSVKFGVGLKDSRRTLSTLLHCQRIPMFPNECLMGNGIFFRANSLHATSVPSIAQEEVMEKPRITKVTAGAKMNLVVVTMCLGSLLLFGIIVSASIIVRMRRKLLRLRHQSAEQPEHENSYGSSQSARIVSAN
ncbi:uncharacterized protein LOC142582549 [Dermacentor variabilis]|uniref:uncharacterized protein LOC142582549 n=1 Tax=Dermacentor variabilis TaxID=34621 RepID=UPI003F5B4C96